MYDSHKNLQREKNKNKSQNFSIMTRTILECAERESHSVVPDSLQHHGLYGPWNSPGQNTGVGSLSLLQGIVPTLGSNLGLPHCRRILYQLSHKGSPRILEWVAYPFSRGSSDPGIEPGFPALQVDSLPTELLNVLVKGNHCG